MPAMYHAANFAKCVSYECKNVYETNQMWFFYKHF
jgi:hypothetical protein